MIKRSGKKALRLTTIAGAILIIFLICALLAPWLAPYYPGKANFAQRLAAPSLAHPFGCDLLGRDLLSRVLYGAQTVFLTAITAVALSCIVGSLLGLAAGYYGGVIDAVIMRFTEAIMAVPPLILAMGISIVMEQNRKNLMLALAFSSLPTFIRIIRGQVKAIRHLPFIQSSRIIGCSESRILFKHIFPNCVIPVIVAVTSSLGSVILAEASLSYLGVGIPSEIPAWGSMVSEGFQYLDISPRLAIIPGLAIVMTVSAFSIIGDRLGDVIRLK